MSQRTDHDQDSEDDGEDRDNAVAPRRRRWSAWLSSSILLGAGIAEIVQTVWNITHGG